MTDTPNPAAGDAPTSALVIGSWPGREFPDNDFVPILLNALKAEGARIVDLPRLDAARLDGVDVLLVHWAEKAFWGARSLPQLAIQALRTLKALRGRPLRVIWIVHNLRPHDPDWRRRVVWPLYRRALERRADGFMTLSPATLPIVRAAMSGLRRKPGAAMRHPCYPDETMAPDDRAAARRALGFADDAVVLGHCGQLRAYKGVDALIGAFAALDRPSARLLLAGRCQDQALAEALRRAAAQDPRVTLVLQDLSPEDYRAALNACDVVVSPFRDYLHSGSLIHALSAGARVATPATPFSTDLRDALPPGWVHLWDGPLTPTALARVIAAPRPRTQDLSALEPRCAARRLLDFARTLRHD